MSHNGNLWPGGVFRCTICLSCFRRRRVDITGMHVQLLRNIEISSVIHMRHLISDGSYKWKERLLSSYVTKSFKSAATSEIMVVKCVGFFFAFRVSLTLGCILNLKNYPMDEQTCRMELESCEYGSNTLPLRIDLNSNVKKHCDFIKVSCSRWIHYQ